MKVWQTLLLFLLLSASAIAQEVNAQAVADAPKKFYQAVNAKDYPAAWSLLTEGSKSRLSEAIAADAKMEARAVRAMFDGNAPELQAGFWESFRTQSRPDLLVQLSFTYIGPSEAGFLVRMGGPNGGGKDTTDLLVKDENGYKFGLTETMKY